MVFVAHYYTQLISDQVNALLDLIANSNDHKLKHLSLEGNILSFVPGHTVASAVCKLQTAEIDRTKLTTEQLDTLFTLICDTTTLKLHTIKLFNINLTQVNPHTLATAVCRLHTAHIGYSYMVDEQCAVLLDMVAESTEL